MIHQRPEMNGLSILNKEMGGGGISASNELFALQKSEPIWIWKDIKNVFSVA